MSDRDERIDALVKRLDPGFDAIGEKLARGIRVTHWEDAWIELLAEYVALEDEKMAHRLEQAGLPAMPRAEAA